MRTARRVFCRACARDLTAKLEPVGRMNADGKPSKAKQLCAPKRVEIVFVFAGYVPAKQGFTVALCEPCAARVTYAPSGVMFITEQ